MITAAQATVLRHIADNAPIEASLTELIKTAILLPLDVYIQATDAGYILSDTGRAALAEYDAQQPAAIVQESKHLTQDELWQRIGEVEEAMDNEQSHYGKSKAWHLMKTEHSILWKLATSADDNTQQPATEAADDLSELQQALNANAVLQARVEQLEALLQEAAQVIAPIVEACNDDVDVMKAHDNQNIYIRKHDALRFTHVEADGYDITVKHLRAVAAFAAKLAARE